MESWHQQVAERLTCERRSIVERRSGRAQVAAPSGAQVAIVGEEFISLRSIDHRLSGGAKSAVECQRVGTHLELHLKLDVV